MEDMPVYKKNDVVEVRNYLGSPLSINMMRFFVEDVDEIKEKSGINFLFDLVKKERFFSERDFHEELRRIGKDSLMKYGKNRLREEPTLRGNGFIGTNKKDNAEAWKNYDKHEIYGSMGREFTYFSPSIPIALNFSCKSSNDIELIELDIDKLSRSRKIFPDPEAIFYSFSREKMFIVMGGMPKKSIKRIYHMKKIQ